MANYHINSDQQPFFALSRHYSCDATVESEFQRTKAESFRFLMSLYDKACGSEHEWFSPWEISKKLGLSEQEVRPLVDHLIKDGLISLRTFDGLIGISHKGVMEIERARSCAGSDDMDRQPREKDEDTHQRLRSSHTPDRW